MRYFFIKCADIFGLLKRPDPFDTACAYEFIVVLIHVRFSRVCISVYLRCYCCAIFIGSLSKRGQFRTTIKSYRKSKVARNDSCCLFFESSLLSICLCPIPPKSNTADRIDQTIYTCAYVRTLRSV